MKRKELVLLFAAALLAIGAGGGEDPKTKTASAPKQPAAAQPRSVPLQRRLLPRPRRLQPRVAEVDAQHRHFRRPLLAEDGEEALEQIRRGHLTLYTFGLRHFDQSYDPDTGLPLEGIAGCIVSDSDLRRAQEHNDYIKNWINQGTPPPNSLRRYNRLIAKPISEISANSFVPLTLGKPVQLHGMKITYTTEHNGLGGADYGGQEHPEPGVARRAQHPAAF